MISGLWATAYFQTNALNLTPKCVDVCKGTKHVMYTTDMHVPKAQV